MNSEFGDMNIAPRVVTTVARANGDDPTDLRPLTDAVDPDALHHLFETPRDVTMELQFEYEGYKVSIDNTGEVSLQPVAE